MNVTQHTNNENSEKNMDIKEQTTTEKSNDLKCTHCDKVFSKKSNLKRHTDSIKVASPWTCGKCKRSVKLKRHMKNHNKNFHKDIHENDLSLCEKCKMFNVSSNCKCEENNLEEMKDSEESNLAELKAAETPQKSTSNRESSQNKQINVAKTKKLRKRCDKRRGCKRKNSQKLEKIKPTANSLCEYCGEVFFTKKELFKHRRQHTSDNLCKYCKKTFLSTKQKHIHEKAVCYKRPTVIAEPYVCRTCFASFKTRWDYMKHREKEHEYRPRRNQTEKFFQDDKTYTPWIDEKGDTDEKLKEIYQQNAHVIDRGFRQGNHMDEFNFVINNNSTYEELHNHLRDIYQRMNNSFKINMAFGFILKNVEDESYRYFYAHNNAGIFDTPKTISNANDLINLFQSLKQIDILQQLFLKRPNTKWTVYQVCNVRYVVFKMLDKHLGNGVLPDYIKNKKCIIGLDVNKVTNRPYTDYLCAFRCLAYFRGHTSYSSMEQSTKLFRNEWFRYKGITDFRGIAIGEMHEFEKLYKVNVNLFQLNQDDSVDVLYRTRCNYKETMNANVYNNHMSYIQDIRRYTKAYKCRSCETLFPTLFRWKRHEQICTKSTKLIFPGKYYSSPRNIFDNLSRVGIEVDRKHCFYPYFIVYDFEAMLRETQNDTAEANTTFTHEHIPISVSVCSNVEGFTTPTCFINKEDLLLKDMFDYIKSIQIETSSRLRKKFKFLFSTLQTSIEKLNNVIEDFKDDQKDNSSSTDDVIDGAMETDYVEPPSEEFLNALSKPNTFRQYLHHLDADTSDSDDNTNTDDVIMENCENDCDDNECLDDYEENNDFINIHPRFYFNYEDTHIDIIKSLKNDLVKLNNGLEQFCDIIPVIGFNSAKYDLNLIKKRLFKIMDLYSEKAFIIKKANSYICIQTDRFRFLDITNYLAPGCSYAQFLKAYETRSSKSFMCYEFLTSYDKLNYPSLPEYQDFYSTLKKCNVLNEEFEAYEKLSDPKPSQPPKTGMENYQELQNIWEREKMSTFADFLKYYNNLDTEPFVEAVEKFLEYYKELNIHPFKEAVSLPGIARHLLLNNTTENNVFALFNKQNQDLYKTFQKNIVGGPSIVFCRYHEVDKTKIRSHTLGQDAKYCKSIQGWDANALYLYTMTLPFPTGHFTRRHSKNNFKKETSDKYKMGYYWLCYEMHKRNIHIQHQFNGGEFVIPPFSVDGLNERDSEVFEYNGCKKIYFLFYFQFINFQLITLYSASKIALVKPLTHKPTRVCLSLYNCLDVCVFEFVKCLIDATLKFVYITYLVEYIYMSVCLYYIL